MPKPRKKESKQDYLKRCTADLIEKEGKDADEAYAVCNSFWNEAKGIRQALTLTAPVMAAKKAEGNTGPRKFLITAYTGSDIESWFGKTVIDVAGIRTNEKIPILREHRRDKVVGWADKQWSEDHTLYLEGEFSEKTRDGKEVLALSDEGFPWQASIGVWPRKIKRLEDDKVEEKVNGRTITGPAEIWTESEVKETSFVALGADDQTAAIALSGDAKDIPVEIETITSNIEEESLMDLKQMKKDYPELLAEIEETAKSDGLQAGIAQGTEAERKRVTEILAADADPEITRKAIADGTPSEQFFRLAYESEKAKRGQNLKEMEESAPKAMGQDVPKEPASEDKRPPHVILNEKAIALSKTEKIEYNEALIRVYQENPDLAAAWQSAAMPN